VKRIHSIELKHFKAFRDTPPIKLGGRNLLLYGPNGSGKSSIFWALYTFLQSSQKPQKEVQKYFDRSHRESLINIDMAEAVSSSIVLQIGEETDGASAVPVRIALDAHETPLPDWQKANLASDFVTYRVLFRFYHFTNSQEIDLWPVFLREILPFCSDNFADAWDDVSSDSNNPYHKVRSQEARGGAVTKIYGEYDDRLSKIRIGLKSTLDSIERTAQAFFNQHFAKDGEKPLTIVLRLTRSPSYDRKKHVLTAPKIGLGITLGGKQITRPQSFLNEAKLTQIALSVRFGATKANLQDAPMKLLVLDDLLISLDMSNRMQVIKVILSDEDFDDYQKIIMTHDRGFYREIRRQIGAEHDGWVFQRLHLENGQSPAITQDPDELKWADALFRQGRYDEAALQLRKAAEEFLRDFVGKAFCAERFVSLSKLLKEAQRQNNTFLLKKLFIVLERWESEGNGALERLLPSGMDDITKDDKLSAEEKTWHCQRRAEMRNLIGELHGPHRDAGRILEQIEQMKDRILNPAAHAGNPPLYASEIEDALRLVRQLRDVLSGRGTR